MRLGPLPFPCEAVREENPLQLSERSGLTAPRRLILAHAESAGKVDDTPQTNVKPADRRSRN